MSSQRSSVSTSPRSSVSTAASSRSSFSIPSFSTLRSFVGLANPTSEEDEAGNTTRALPSIWYTSPEMWSLERRSIFSRKWQLITHKVRLSKSGDWLKYNVAGYEFVLARDREGNISGFHNVCRHRAFPVVLGESGTSRIFSCKYHGWSYGLNGKLTKAPGYQELERFDKSKNNLLPVHVHVDYNGFIWVNFDRSGKDGKPEIAWEDDFAGIDRQERYKDLNFDDYVHDHDWNMDGTYNWKILADNYNECYHCATTHPDIPDVANLETYSVDTDNGKILHNPGTTDEQRASGLTVASTYYFPNVSTNITPHFFMIQRFVPSGPASTSMRYEVYRNRHSSDADFDRVNKIYKRVMSEDKELCHLAQTNLNAGVFINGEMHPRLEKGPLHFQKTVREVVMGHWRRENEEMGGREFWPAKQVLPESGDSRGEVSREDVEFCMGLSCGVGGLAKEQLAW